MSGNPGGRPKRNQDLQALARKHTPECLQVLRNCLDSDDERVQCVAAQALLDRGWGKAPQAITGADGEALQILIVNYSPEQP